ncbi:(2Fe-2S)-binding protein [Rhizobium leguminosarum bv. trifolii WSM1689]|jgi:isoquinoline 1-oxidoreductase subunit alpha|uniref:(2Fe-2S)-binding protein n=1 Tax=Rhizobium TaxID=379 RepID=UPI0003E0BF2E|nr:MULTISPECIES: (2Fe-2S)-binding protein [Rhizobium]AHF85441.1 (2Fe-2S)-binding protein [Rhizobium leguminosarum bv. trifolii WSM1689]MBY3136721.1 (2Fe-2S)-binding protein [Rhizobium laguerreae]MBY3224324.1 (2Fe-2S)-binding protein [Rhizobium laguerreae]MBY3232670.1 (2Fe-2S)-binding protein [Rhizobium laguerreae]MBY3447909.1 (2Fe-2S)-binding protein [Rhizobium laguerreae]
MVELVINGRSLSVDAEVDKPLLWVLREDLGLLGPKYGCGIAQCGACRVLIDGKSTPSCITPVGSIAGASVVTVEGLAQANGALSAVQQAWLDEQVPQCGFCQPGFIVATTALLEAKPRPTDADIDEAITNICRCGTYPRIRRAIHRAAAMLAER